MAVALFGVCETPRSPRLHRPLHQPGPLPLAAHQVRPMPLLVPDLRRLRALHNLDLHAETIQNVWVLRMANIGYYSLWLPAKIRRRQLSLPDPGSHHVQVAASVQRDHLLGLRV